jgi:hypothetical protein
MQRKARPQLQERLPQGLESGNGVSSIDGTTGLIPAYPAAMSGRRSSNSTIASFLFVEHIECRLGYQGSSAQDFRKCLGSVAERGRWRLMILLFICTLGCVLSFTGQAGKTKHDALCYIY